MRARRLDRAGSFGRGPRHGPPVRVHDCCQDPCDLRHGGKNVNHERAGMGRPSNPQSSLFPEDYEDYFNPHSGKFLTI